MKFFAPIILLFVSPLCLFAQNNQPLLWSGQGIEVSSQTEQCVINPSASPFEFEVLKVRNTNNFPVTLTLQVNVHYNTHCDGCGGGDESLLTLELAPGQELRGSCESVISPRLQLLKSSPYLTDLTFLSVSLQLINFVTLNLEE